MTVELVELLAILLCIVLIAAIRAAADVMPSIAQCMNEARLSRAERREHAQGNFPVDHPPPMPVRRPPPAPRG
jgi:hypothetical protein